MKILFEMTTIEDCTFAKVHIPLVKASEWINYLTNDGFAAVRNKITIVKVDQYPDQYWVDIHFYSSYEKCLEVFYYYQNYGNKLSCGKDKIELTTKDFIELQGRYIGFHEHYEEHGMELVDKTMEDYLYYIRAKFNEDNGFYENNEKSNEYPEYSSKNYSYFGYNSEEEFIMYESFANTISGEW